MSSNSTLLFGINLVITLMLCIFLLTSFQTMAMSFYKVEKLLFVLPLLSSFVSSQEVAEFRAINEDRDIKNIIEGTDIEIGCRVINFNVSTDTLLVYRHTSYEEEKLATNSGTNESTPSNIQFAGFKEGSGPSVFRLDLDVLNITRFESGSYTCQTSHRFSNAVIDSQSFLIDVQYPPAGQPECTPARQDVAFIEGEQTQLQCLSEAGNPEVHLQWNSTGGIAIPEADIRFIQNGTQIVSIISLKVDINFTVANFTCLRKSDQFPLSNGFCVLGPFTITDGLFTPPQTSDLKTLMTTSQLDDFVTTQDLLSFATKGNVIVITLLASAGVLFIIMFIIIAVLLAKPGWCKYTHKKNKSQSQFSDKSPLEMTSHNEAQKPAQDEVQYNPVQPVRPISPDIGIGQYTVVNKKSSRDETKYPSPPEYPRPPKSNESAEGVTSSSPTKRLTKETPAYTNTLDIPTSRRRQSAPSKAPPPPPEEAGHEECLSASTERGDSRTDVPLYADTSAVTDIRRCVPESKSNSVHLPAPEEAPPPPPKDSVYPNQIQTPGLEYANLNLRNMSSSGSSDDCKPKHGESVVYSSLSR